MSVRPAALWLVALLLASCAREIRTADSGSIDAGLGADGTPEDTPDAASAPDSGLSSDSGVALDVEPPDSGAAPDSGVGPDSGELPDTGLAPDGGCVPACGTRTCGPDPVCGQTCGSCTDTQACAAGGMCLEECRPGATICSPDGFGLQSCGLNDVLGFRDYGARVPCAGGQACDPASHACQRSACLPAQVMIVLDRSASLSANSAWVWVKDDVLGTLRSHEHVGAYGLRTFPSGACAAGPVMTPALVSAAAIEAAIAPPTVEASSPLAAALSGLDAAFSGADEGRAIFLLTDGNDSCAPAGEAEAIVSRFHRAGIKTYTLRSPAAPIAWPSIAWQPWAAPAAPRSRRSRVSSDAPWTRRSATSAPAVIPTARSPPAAITPAPPTPTGGCAAGAETARISATRR